MVKSLRIHVRNITRKAQFAYALQTENIGRKVVIARRSINRMEVATLKMHIHYGTGERLNRVER